MDLKVTRPSCARTGALSSGASNSANINFRNVMGYPAVLVAFARLPHAGLYSQQGRPSGERSPCNSTTAPPALCAPFMTAASRRRPRSTPHIIFPTPNASPSAGPIRREALAIAGVLDKVPRFHDIMPAQADISANDGRDWRVFIMKAYGVTVENNLQRCPTVAALLDEAPEVVSAILSFLAPGKHVPEHRGPFRGILRFHLMLSIPRDGNGVPACVMNIDGVPYRLGDGESLLWDDTYRHEVWNRSDQEGI